MLEITPRQVVIASPGYSIVGIDFASQELMIAAVWSQDPKMLGTFSEPSTKTREDGSTYKNPWADLHTLSTVFCCYPQIFEGVSEDKWVEVANRPLENGIVPRKVAKVLNFGILFMQTAQSLADQRHVPLDVAESWVKNHQKTYSTFHQWAARHAAHGELCGWTATPWQRRIRWVQEANAKKSGESAARSGVNNVIQATGSNIGKLALSRVGRYTRRNGIRLLAMVHDEIVFEVPGVCKLDREKSRYKGEVCIEPVWIPEERTLEMSREMKKIMEDAEKEVFGGVMEGRCSVAIAPYWSK